MAEDEFRRAVRYGESAINLLKKGAIPPYPQFYELLYTYATGVNPTLNARINTLFIEAEGQPVDLPEKLYNEFLRAHDVEERLNNVSAKMSSQIESVSDAIGSAISSADAYTGSLQAASGDLGRDMGKEELKKLAERLLSETKQMQTMNRALEDSLQASRDDIATLQRDLDDVRRESLLDPLTRIFNRKCFDQGLERAIQDSRSSQEPLSLILLDIDRFKTFNDTFGHQTGDQVLRLVAMTLKSNVKGNDLAARYGGEEFAAVLPATDLQGALALAENVRKAIQSKELLKRSTNEKLGRITASFGVATLGASDNVISLIERADLCLYAAKHAGRNCVIGENDKRMITQMPRPANSAA